MFLEPEEAAKGLAISRDHFTRQLSSFAEAETFTVDQERPSAILAEAKARQARQLTTAEALQILSCYGIPLASWAEAGSAEEASTQAEALGYPVALKVMGEGFVHKSDVGGVLLNLYTEAEVQDAYEKLATLIQKTESGAQEKTVLVQKMVAAGHEVFVGGKQDPVFGPVILVGLGGVYVEIFEDVAIRVAPVSAVEARKMFTEIRGGKLLEGVRGEQSADLEKLVEITQRLSQLICDLPQIQELDLNPLKALPRGQGCLAVDCRMVLEDN